MRIRMWRHRLCAVIFLTGSCLLTAEISAQEKGDEPDPVKWSVKSTLVPPGSIVVQLTADIERGWHLYSTERVEGGPSPTRITVPNKEFEIAGEIDSPAPHSAYDPNFQVATESYEGSVTFQVPVKIMTREALWTNLRVQVRYQTCSPTICLPPKLIELAPLPEPDAKPGVPPKRETEVNVFTVGSLLSDFDFNDFNGAHRNSSEFRGRVILLDFWASWCSPCLADIPELKGVYQKFHAQGFEIIGLNSEAIGQKDVDAEFVKSGAARAREIVRTRGVNWTQSVNATSLPVASRFGVESLPAKFLIDREGRLIARINKVSELEAVLRGLLSPKP